MGQFVAFLLAVLVGVLLWRTGDDWTVALAMAVPLWWIGGAIAWRLRRRSARAAVVAAETWTKQRFGTDVACADPLLNVLVAVNAARTQLFVGTLDGVQGQSWPIADIVSAKVETDTGWGLLLDRERTPFGRVLTTLYYPLQPIVAIMSLFSFLDGSSGGDDVFVRSERVRAIRIVAQTRTSPIDITIYDEHRSVTHPGASKARMQPARDLVAAIRRGIVNAGGTIA